MSMLDTFTMLVQADRAKLLDMIQSNVAIAGTALQPPFRLTVPGSGTAGALRKADIIIRSVQLSLLPGTADGALHLGIEAGVVRPDGLGDHGFTGGELVIAFRFERGYLFAFKLLNVSLAGVASITGQTAVAINNVVNRIIETDKLTTFELFQFDDKNPGSARTKAMFIPFVPKNIDAATVGLFFGDGNFSLTGRAITGNNSFSLAVSADYTREHILCRALLNSDETDPAWQEGAPPTDNERAILPSPCGSGALPRGNDDASIDITEMNFGFRDGYLDVSGTFNAKDTCWKVNNGSFSQKAMLNFVPQATKFQKNAITGQYEFVTFPAQIQPVFEPTVPNVNYDAEVLFICKLLGFIGGVIIPKIGGVILGTIVVAAMDIGSSMVNPSIPATHTGSPFLPTIEQIQWTAISVSTEGLLLQGDRTADRFPDAHQLSLVRFESESVPINGIEGPQSETVYQPLMCEPRTFKYIPYYKDDIKILQAVTTFAIEPVIYKWFVNGNELSGLAANIDGSTMLTYTGTIKTAVPPPDGVSIPGHEIKLGYNLYHTGPLGPVRKIKLSPRAADKRYDILVEMKATDAAGRVFWDSHAISFEGVTALFGQDYTDYRNECFRKLQAAMAKRAKSLRPKPGEPQQGLDGFIDYLGLYVKAGRRDVAQVIDAAVKMHGLEAVSKAIGKNKLSL